jgi:hypothetical protein
MLYAFMALVTLLLFIRLTQVNYQQKQQDKSQPKDYVMASGDLVSSPLAAALDPRVDQATAQQQLMAEPAVTEPGQGIQQELVFELHQTESDRQHPSGANQPAPFAKASTEPSDQPAEELAVDVGHNNNTNKP